MAEQKQKVFGVGMHRTGTTSLRSAMPMLGYRTVKPWRWTGRYSDTLKKENVLTDAFYLSANYDAAIYMPFMTFYKELYLAYPDAKFILTERNEDSWVKSMTDFFGKRNWPEVRFAFGCDATPENEESLRAVFRRHNREVKRFFEDKPGSLLVMNLSKGDGWKELCDFIGADAPNAAFPKSNERDSLYAHVVMRAIPTIATLRQRLTGESNRRLQQHGSTQKGVIPQPRQQKP